MSRLGTILSSSFAACFHLSHFISLCLNFGVHVVNDVISLLLVTRSLVLLLFFFSSALFNTTYRMSQLHFSKAKIMYIILSGIAFPFRLRLIQTKFSLKSIFVCALSSFMLKLKTVIIGNCQQTWNCHNKFDVKIDYRNDNQQKSVDSIEMLNNCKCVCVCLYAHLLLLLFRLIVYTLYGKCN